MAYKNLETGRIYLSMAQAPICEALNIGVTTNICHECPIVKIAKERGDLDRLQFYDFLRKADDLGCADIAKKYGDEVATAFGYERIVFNDSQEESE